MSAAHQKLDDEPIVIVTYRGQITVQDIEETTAESGAISSASSEPLYWIMDLSQSEPNFQDAIYAITQLSRDAPGTVSGERGRVFLVGNHRFVRFFQDVMSQPQYGSLNIPLFRGLDDALAALRVKIQTDRRHHA